MDCIVHGVTKSWTRLSDFHTKTSLSQSSGEWGYGGGSEAGLGNKLIVGHCICKEPAFRNQANASPFGGKKAVINGKCKVIGITRLST